MLIRHEVLDDSVSSHNSCTFQTGDCFDFSYSAISADIENLAYCSAIRAIVLDTTGETEAFRYLKTSCATL